MFDKLVELIVQFIHLFFFCFITLDYERGVVLRWGKFNRLAGPGHHWKWPFLIERYFAVNVVPETMTVGPQSLTTKDNRSVVLSSVVTFRIENVQTFLLEVEGGHQVIEDSTYGVQADFVMKRTWAELCAMESISNEMAKAVRRRAKVYGVDIMSVQPCDFTASRSIRLISALNHHSYQGS